jgi:hypothetical protein
MDPRFFRRYLDILSEAEDDKLGIMSQSPSTANPKIGPITGPIKKPNTPEEIQARLDTLDAELADITPGFNQISPDSDGGDSIVSYTTPNQARQVRGNPDAYRYGTDRKKDIDFQKPLINKDQWDLAPRGYSDFSPPPGMDTNINNMPAYPKKYNI